VIAVVTSRPKNNGTAINKVADFFVRLGQRRNIAAVIPLTKTRPERLWATILTNIGPRNTQMADHRREQAHNTHVNIRARAGANRRAQSPARGVNARLPAASDLP
jgi:hypothetical protein